MFNRQGRHSWSRARCPHKGAAKAADVWAHVPAGERNSMLTGCTLHLRGLGTTRGRHPRAPSHRQGRTSLLLSSTLLSSHEGSRGDKRVGGEGQGRDGAAWPALDGHRPPSAEGHGSQAWNTAILILSERKRQATAPSKGKREYRKGIQTRYYSLNQR